ncbi:MAG: alkaline phosphatase family protein [Candidatus Brocadiales bacterium]
MKRHFFLFGLLALFCALLSCATIPLEEEITLGPNAIQVPATESWTKTDISVQPNQFIHIVAQGKIEIDKRSFFGRDYDYIVGPEGTYNFSKKVKDEEFPLPAAEAGPTPCYALIGKIGEDGDAFLIGRETVVKTAGGGNLYLGINDFNVGDNRGNFYAKVESYQDLPRELVTRDTRKIEEGTGVHSTPIEDARVLIIYLDGIDYNVLMEMAYKGYLPNIKKHFIDGGVDFPYSYTVFPSTTWTSTACFLSGNFNDLTGIKSDAFLDKRVGKMRHFFHPYGPITAARRMKPGAVGHIVDEYPRAEVLPTIFDRMEKSELKMYSTVLPVLFDHPPTFYGDILTNNLRYFGTHRIKSKFDKLNATFALHHVIKTENRVMYVWLPGVDARSHETPRGQWGAARKELYLIDRHIGDMIEKLKLEGIYDKTYMILYSDHGHIGGKDFINQAFDITHDFFYKSIIDMDGDGELDEDSGMGFNVKFVQHDESLHREHIGRDKQDFMAVGNMGYGAAVIYLPYKHKYSRNFAKRNSYYDLTHYQVHPTMKPVNILDRLLKVDYSERNKFPDVVASKPVDLLIVPVAKDTTLIINSQGLQALIEKRSTGEGKRSFEYRYRIITDFDQDQDGNNTFNTTKMKGIKQAGPAEASTEVGPTEEVTEGIMVVAEDPLHYTSTPSFMKYIGNNVDWLNDFHSAQEWLEATKECKYPDAVVAFSHFTSWDDSIKNLKERFAPDFGITSKKGWSFQTDLRLATDHGYPLRESMKIPLFVTGPNIKKGVINTTPHRIVDVVPTVLNMVGVEYDESALDGKAIADIYEGEAEEGPVFVRDKIVAFHTDSGLPVEYGMPTPELGYNMHDIDNPYDLHYLAADVATSFDQRGFRMTDDILDLFIPGPPVRPFDSAINAIARDFKAGQGDNLFVRRTSQLFEALRIRQFDISDGVSMLLFQFFFTQENFWRANLVIDWTQDIMGDFNRLLGAPVFHGEKGLIPGTKYLNYVIDYPQLFLQRLVKIFFEAFTRLGYRAIFGVEDGLSAFHNATIEKTWQTPEIVGPKEESPFKLLDISE